MKEKNLKIISLALLVTMSAYSMPVFAYTKDETVYSKLDQSGNEYKTVVSTHLKNDEEDETLNDLSNLLNITNTNGDEDFKKDGNSLIWNTNKEDIYYEGESQEKLPIECNVIYKLDGKETNASEIAGKSGKVTIELNYQNKDKHIVSVNGKNVTMYTPFIVVAGTIINNKNNENINVSNGKIIDDGTKSVVIGMAMPGLQESLGVSKKTIDIPNSIQITMNATNFESNSIITFVTPKVIEKDDLSFFDKLDNLYTKINTLQDGVNQLEVGTKALSKGTEKLSSAVGELKAGSSATYAGANKIKSEVIKSTKTLTSNNSEALNEQTISAIGIQASNKAEKQIAANNSTIQKQAENAVASIKLSNTDKANIGLSVKQGLQANAGYNALSTTEQEMIYQFAVSSAISTAEIVTKNTAKNVAGETAKSVAKTTATATAKTTAEETAREVSNQVKNASILQVTEQMTTLGKVLEELTNGLYKLDNGTTKLQNGANELSEKTNDLSEGVSRLNEEGIKQICSYINGNVKDIGTRVEKLTSLAKQYNNFTMLNENNNGNVKFIMIIDAIKKQQENENKKEQAILNTDQNDNLSKNYQENDN